MMSERMRIFRLIRNAMTFANECTFPNEIVSIEIWYMTAQVFFLFSMKRHYNIAHIETVNIQIDFNAHPDKSQTPSD